MSERKRLFLEACDSEDSAWGVARYYAKILRDCGLTGAWGIQVKDAPRVGWSIWAIRY